MIYESASSTLFHRKFSIELTPLVSLVNSYNLGHVDRHKKFNTITIIIIKCTPVAVEEEIGSFFKDAQHQVLQNVNLHIIKMICEFYF